MLTMGRPRDRYARSRVGNEMSPDQAWSARGARATAALAETWASLAGLGQDLDAGDWDRPTACPGWDVKDQFSHLIGIERLLLGEATPTWDQPLGDHVRNDFAAMHEPWVAVRRALDGPVVQAEFVEVTTRRLAALEARGEEEWALIGYSPAGEVPYAEFMDLRVFDSWVHEQDVRAAVGQPGGSGGLASSMALDNVEKAMGYVVGKKAAAPEGSVVTFAVTGAPGDERRFSLQIAGGRATRVPEPEAGTVTVTLSSLDFMRLGCGRTTPAAVDAAKGLGLAGDPALAQAIVNSMNFMF
jgi:uncharacterized protein (TIGR03083 family)